MPVNGPAIRRLRNRNRWSLRDLAERTGLGASYLCEMELGRKPGNENKAQLLANALGVELTEVFEEDPVFEPHVLDEIKLDGDVLAYSPARTSQLVDGVVSPGWLERKALRGEIESSLIGGKTCFTPENIRALIRPRVAEVA